MAFDFLFEDDAETNRRQLCQGDVLFRSAALAAAVGEAHKYYAEADDYTHFMVLTQSCDLVRRAKKKLPRSRYISICAVRPVSIVIDRLIDRYRHSDDGSKIGDFPLPLCTKDNEILVRQKIEHLLHNTEDGFFFLPRGSHSAIAEDLCAFLPLSIALRAEHYETCLVAKAAQLRPVFQAKVGWLAGNQYSRVATPDLEERAADPQQLKDQYFDSLLYQRSVWLTGPQFKELRSRVRDWRAANPGVALGSEQAADLVKSLPTHLEIVAKRVIHVLVENKILDAGVDKEKAVRLLANDSVLRRLIKPS